MSAICVVSETSKILSNMEKSADGGMHLDPSSLPFHLCSLLIFVVLYITFGKEGKAKRLMINFIAVVGTIGGVCAILIPTNGTNFAAIDAYQCFVYHAGLVWFSLYLIITGQAKLGSIKCLCTNLTILLVAVFALLYVNGALSYYDTNFLYLTRPPMDSLPYLNLDSGWYIYFIRVITLGLAVIILFHLPFIIKVYNADKRQNRIKENK